MDRPESIEETAELVETAGGVGIPVRVDHTVIGEVSALAQRVPSEQDGRLDVLVNDIWGGDPLTDVMRWSGRTVASWEASDTYGFTDLDGRTPHWGNHLRSALDASIS